MRDYFHDGKTKATTSSSGLVSQVPVGETPPPRVVDCTSVDSQFPILYELRRDAGTIIPLHFILA